MRKFYYIALALGFMCIPLKGYSESAIEIIEIENDGQRANITSLKITNDNGGQTVKLRVTNAVGQSLFIYDVSGTPIKRIKVDGIDKVYELNLRKGCYIVKVSNIVRKVSVS